MGVTVKGGDPTGQPVEWAVGAGLLSAVRAYREKRTEFAGIEPVIVLVGAKADNSLVSFSHDQGVRIVELDLAKVEKIIATKSKESSGDLKKLAENLFLHDVEASVAAERSGTLMGVFDPATLIRAARSVVAESAAIGRQDAQPPDQEVLKCLAGFTRSASAGNARSRPRAAFANNRLRTARLEGTGPVWTFRAPFYRSRTRLGLSNPYPRAACDPGEMGAGTQ